MAPHLLATRETVHNFAHRLQERLRSLALRETTLTSVPTRQSLTHTRTRVHYHDHIIPLPGLGAGSFSRERTLSISPSNTLSPVPSRLAVVPRPSPLVAAYSPACLRIDLGDLPALSHVPQAGSTTATFPPTSRIQLVSPHLPAHWKIVLEMPSDATGSLLLSRPFTPEALLTALHVALLTTLVSPRDWMAASPTKRARVSQACASRGAQQVAWIDWLEQHAVFGGLSKDSNLLPPSHAALDDKTWILLMELR
ncbi:hypothetical protein BKA62DRAFT_300650 [Auriculariales sp. MPI-PUGE-AT-0066]|nr:hypothetical protein BKA62DRAFT_300650 [Auriculariales sp. MPI-PUGE-AT-0066]